VLYIDATAPVATAGGASPLPTPKPTPLSPPKAPASPAPEPPTTTAALPGPVDRAGGPACAESGVRWLSDVTPGYEDWRAQALLNTQPPPAFDMELEVMPHVLECHPVAALSSCCEYHNHKALRRL
jgi:hypothetical protein